MTARNILAFIALGAVTLWISSCNSESEPKIDTLEISDITGSGAKSGGTITDDGGSEIIARGVCWNTLPEPNINNSLTTDGSGSGSFTSEISGLEKNTKYYVRAYATNEIGTGYGDEFEFTTASTSEVTVNGKTYMFHEDAEYTSAWGPLSTTGAISVSSGQSNTDKLAQLSSESAAKKCAESTALGFDDWFLPASQELFSIFEADKTILPVDVLIWSSTETSDESASGFYSENGTPYAYDYYKADVNNCICTRIKN